VWYRDGKCYFLASASEDGNTLTWHANRAHGVKFSTPENALNVATVINNKRKILTGTVELHIVDEEVVDDDEDFLWQF
jgi:hypothetical protein